MTFVAGFDLNRIRTHCRPDLNLSNSTIVIDTISFFLECQCIQFVSSILLQYVHGYCPFLWSLSRWRNIKKNMQVWILYIDPVCSCPESYQSTLNWHNIMQHGDIKLQWHQWHNKGTHSRGSQPFDSKPPPNVYNIIQSQIGALTKKPTQLVPNKKFFFKNISF